MATTPCADRDALEAYSLGTLQPDAAVVLEDHLARCAACQDAMESLESEADELVAGLRQAREIDSLSKADQDEVDRLMALVGTGATVSTVVIADRPAGHRLERPAGPVPITARDFSQCLRESGLLTEQELRPLLRDFPGSLRDGAISLARWLVEQDRLTRFQAAELCCGRPRGLKLGDYCLVEEIGQGGMGRVYKAHNLRMQRDAAIKVLAPHLFALPEIKQRFWREVRAIARLSHPNVVKAYDAGEQSDILYLAMEYVDGANLGELVAINGPLPVGQAVNYVCQAARGLSSAHEQGIVHRDVKPSNLLVSRSGTVQVSDLGLARFLSPGESDTELTETGQVLGTCDYMSPEQAFHTGQADERSDIYSLGWTLFHLLTAEVPFPAPSRLAKILAHRDAPIPSLQEKCANLPADLDRLFQRMVSKRPEDRPQAMRDVVEALTGIPDEEPGIEPPLIARSHPPDLDQFFRKLELQTRGARRRQLADASRTSQRRKTFRRVAAGVVLTATALSVGTYSLLMQTFSAEGELVVAVDDAYADQLDIRVLKDQQLVTVLDSQRGWRARLGKGTYDLSVGKGSGRFHLDRRTVAVQDQGSETIHVRLEIPTPEVPVDPEKPAAPESPPVAAVAEERSRLEAAEDVGAANLFGEIGQISVPQRVNAIALSRGKDVVYAASSDNNVYVVDLGKMVITQRLRGHAKPVVDLALSHDGSRLVTCGGDRTIRIWDLRSGNPQLRIDLLLTPWCVAFSPDNRFVLAALHVKPPGPVNPAAVRSPQYRSLVMFDAETGNFVKSLTDDRETFYWSIAFSPAGSLVAAGSQEGFIALIDVASGEITRRLLGHRGPTHCVVFSSDGKRLFSGDNAGFVYCHLLSDGSRLYQRGFRSGIKGIDLSADELRLVLEGSIDVRVLEMGEMTEQALTNLHGHTAPISGLLFLADEGRAVSGGWDGTVRIWKLPPRKQAAEPNL